VRSGRNVGRRRAGGPRPDGPVTAFSLLACPDRPSPPPAPQRELPVPAGLLSDLHDPRLIITAEYVGPDRRLVDRREWRSLERERSRYRAWPPARTLPEGGVGTPRVKGTISFRLRHLVAAVLLTAVTVVPLTVLVSHRAAPTVPPASPTHLAPHPASGTPFRP
jgi:hypothetical protein